MANFIVQRAPQNVIDDYTNIIRSLRSGFLTYSVNLTDEEKKGRTMAEGREGLARLVSKIAVEHVNHLSRTDDPQALADALNYDAALETMRQTAIAFLEQVTDTQMANSMDVMTLVDRYSVTLQTNRNSNAALDEAMHEVDEWNKRFTNTGNTTPRNTGATEAGS